MHNGDIILYANESAAYLYGTTVNEIVGISLMKIIDPEYFDHADALMQEILVNNRQFLDIELKILNKNGQILDAVLSAIPIYYLGKRAILASYRNITERKKMEQALKESEDRYRQLVDFSPLGIVVHQKGVIKYANSMASRLLGTEKTKDLIGLNIGKIIHPDYRILDSRRVLNIEKSGQIAPLLYEKFIRLDGQEIDVEVNGMPIQLNGEPAVQVVFWDITEKKKEEDLIRYRAYHDTLTDLANRLKFQLDLEEEINKDTLFTIMYLDLNGLKPINDTYGHQAGDIALIKVASRLTGVIGSGGLVYRLGGDEFAIVFPGQKKEEEIKELANRIAEIVIQPVYVSNAIVQISVSIGVVFYPVHGIEMEMLLRHADMAMYHAKRTNTTYKIYDQ